MHKQGRKGVGASYRKGGREFSGSSRRTSSLPTHAMHSHTNPMFLTTLTFSLAPPKLQPGPPDKYVIRLRWFCSQAPPDPHPVRPNPPDPPSRLRPPSRRLSSSRTEGGPSSLWARLRVTCTFSTWRPGGRSRRTDLVEATPSTAWRLPPPYLVTKATGCRPFRVAALLTAA